MVGFWELGNGLPNLFIAMLSNTQNDDTEYVALVEGTADEYYVSETYVVNRRKKQKAFSGEIARKNFRRNCFHFLPMRGLLRLLAACFWFCYEVAAFGP